jgi:hypothetical protein
VPKGKAAPKIRVARTPTRYRATDPIAPPDATSNIAFILHSARPVYFVNSIG